MANLACVGATPVAVVNCLNFGNPEHPAVMWQLSECIDGLADTCRAFDLPVIGGNVSFYNESGGTDIHPTPVLGVLGLVDELVAPPPGLAWRDRDTVVLLGARTAARGFHPLDGTRWMAERSEEWAGNLPELDIQSHLAASGFVAGLVAAVVGGRDERQLVHAVHDVSGGGVAVALAEMAAAAGIGCRLQFEEAAELFTELPSRFVVSTADPARLCALAGRKGVPAAVLGRVGGLRLTLGKLVDLPVSAVVEAHQGNLARRLGDQ